MLRLRPSLLLLLVVSAPVGAQQSRVRLGVASGRLWQGAPATTESGYVVATDVVTRIGRDLRLVTALEYSRSHVESVLAVCYFVHPSGACFRRPRDESLVAASGALDVRLFPSALLHLHVAPGVAVVRSLAPANPGERRLFGAPQLTIGVVWGRSAEWSVDVRLRRLDRWAPLTSSGQSALLFGVTL